MPAVTGAWDEPAVETFLEDAVVPIRLACSTGQGLWMLSLWFDYDGGRLRCATAADADVVSFLRRDPETAFEVSTNEPPYRGVRGAGRARVEPDEDKAVLETLYDRYLDDPDREAPLADVLFAPDREEARIVIEPRRLHSWDYSERMGPAVER